VMTIAGAEFWQRAFAAKDRKSALEGQFGGTLVYAVTIGITLFLGLAAAILFPNLLQEYGTADYAIPVMVATILPAGLTGIEESAFQYCLSLTSVQIPDLTCPLEKRAFMACSALTRVRFPALLESIGEETFAFCDLLEEVALPEGLEALGTGAFANCPALKELRLPASLHRISGNPVYGSPCRLSRMPLWLRCRSGKPISFSSTSIMCVSPDCV